MTTATSVAGGLGILATATLSPKEAAQDIRRIEETTDPPLGVNFFSVRSAVDQIFTTIIPDGVRVVSFSRGSSEARFRRFGDAGVMVIPTIGRPRHAEKVVGWGADAVIAQGAEGGGHTGSIATSLLVPAAVETVDVPVVTAGGLREGRVSWPRPRCGRPA